MGTEVLLPQELFAEGFHHVSTAAAFHRRRNLNFNGKGYYKKTSPKPEKKKINDVGSGSLVMGKVTLLRRGESLDSLTSGIKGGSYNNKARLSNRKPVDDLAVYGIGRIGPDSPEMVPKCIRFPAPGDGYAGSAFSSSPSPRSVPVPLFFKKGRNNCKSKSFDDLATRDLRRLLRLN